MALIQRLITTDKYSLKCPYTMTPKGICIHNTANDGSAKNEISYMQTNNSSTSFHIAVDDIEAIQGLPFNRNGWHSGDGEQGEGNRHYIGLEICYSKSGGERFTKAEQRASKEVALLSKQYGWTIANVKKHQDFSNKYCPHRTLDLGWQRFLNMVQAELNNLNKPQASSTGEIYRVRKTWEDRASQIGAYAVLENAIKSCKAGYTVYNSKGEAVYTNKPVEKANEYIVKEYAETGKFTCTVDYIYFRNKPIISNDNAIIDRYNRGESVYYNRVILTNLYTYISWISASTGTRRYMPVRDLITKEVWGTFI